MEDVEGQIAAKSELSQYDGWFKRGALPIISPRFGHDDPRVAACRFTIEWARLRTHLGSKIPNEVRLIALSFCFIRRHVYYLVPMAKLNSIKQCSRLERMRGVVSDLEWALSAALAPMRYPV